jgi:hypothetical protein
MPDLWVVIDRETGVLLGHGSPKDVGALAEAFAGLDRETRTREARDDEWLRLRRPSDGEST